MMDDAHRNELLNPKGVPVDNRRQGKAVTALYRQLERDLLSFFSGVPTLVLQSRGWEFAIKASMAGSMTAVVMDDGIEHRAQLLNALVANTVGDVSVDEYQAALDKMNSLDGQRSFLERYAPLLHKDALGHLSAARDYCQAAYHRNNLGNILYATIVATAARYLDKPSARRVVFSRLPLGTNAGVIREPKPADFVSEAAKYSSDATLVYANLYRRGEHPELIRPEVGLLESIARMDSLPNIHSSGRIPRSAPEYISRSVLGDEKFFSDLLGVITPNHGVAVLPVRHFLGRERDRLLRATGAAGVFSAGLKFDGEWVAVLVGDEQIIRQFIYTSSLSNDPRAEIIFNEVRGIE